MIYKRCTGTLEQLYIETSKYVTLLLFLWLKGIGKKIPNPDLLT